MFLLEDRVLFDAAIAIDIAEAANPDDQSDDFDNSSDNSAEQNAEAFLQSPSEVQQAMPLPVNPYIDALITDALEGNLAALGLDGDLTLPVAEQSNNEQVQVLLISDSLENADELYESTGENTIAIRYDAANTTTEQLLEQIEQSLDGETIDRLGIAQQSDSNGKIDLLTNDSDSELWTGLNALMSDDASIDLFASDMADSEFTDALAELTGHEVNYSDDLTGSNGDWTLENGNIDLANTYFDGELAQNINFSVIPAEPTHELAIINSSVMDVDDILDDLGDNVDILILDADSDPLDQINDYLDANDAIEYNAMHIISHGNDGYFVLNGQIVDGDYATDNAADFAAIGEHLTADGDIMIYGCDLAANAEGQSLVAQLAALTGADIAASNDTTANIGGNWDLEYSIGLIDSSSFNIEGYSYHLTDWSVVVNSSSGVGSLRDMVDNHAVGGDSISFNIDGTDTVDIGTTDIDITVGLSINGHNNGTGTDGTAGNSNVTVQVTTPGTSGTAARVFAINAPDATINISNMTIKGGDIYSSTGNIDNNYGGGILLLGGTLNLSTVEISECRAHSGGGIAVYSDGTIVELNIANSTISHNLTYYGSGGGIYFWADGISTTINIENSFIDYNESLYGNGGGVYMRIANGDMTVYITDSSISHNRGSFGGGIYTQLSLAQAELHISTTTISDNFASNNAGAIYNYSCDISLTDCEINNNVSSSSNGAIYNYSPSAGRTTNLDIINCTINSNNSRYVGTIYNYAWYGTAITTITGSTIDGNTTSYDGTIYNRAFGNNSNAQVIIEDSTISSNTVKHDNGGSIFNEAYYANSSATVNLTNCTISGNSASHGGGIYNLAYYADSNATINLQNSTIIGNMSSYVGSGVYNYYKNSGGNAITNLTNTIVAYNYLASNSGYADIYNNGTISGDNNIVGKYTLTGLDNIYYSYTSGFGYPLFDNYETIVSSTLYKPVIAANGGLTFTAKLINNSIAIAAGTAIDAPFTDQRGVPRFAPPSIGAYDILSDALYFRSSHSGDWSDASNWEYSGDNIYWSNAIITPDANNSLGIAINNELTLNTDITLDQTTVNSGGNLRIATGNTVTLADGVGVDLSITGQMTLLDNNQLINNGTMSINIGSTIAYSGTDQDILNWNYDNILLNGSGTKILTDNIELTGNLLQYNVTFDHNGHSVTYNGNDQIIAAVNYSTLILSGAGATKTFAVGTTTIEHEIVVADNMNLTGSTPRDTTLQVQSPGTTNSRVFNITATGEVNIANLTIKGGNISGNGGAIYTNSGSLNMDNVAISNSAAYNGGAIYNTGSTINITNSTINSNIATNNGGAIYNNSGSITLLNSTVAYNSALSSSCDGGGIYLNSGTVQIINSTISNNRADNDGGAIFSQDNLYILNSAIINNSAGNNGEDICSASGSAFIYFSRYDNLYGSFSTEINAPNQTGTYNGELDALNDNGGSTDTMAVIQGTMVGNGSMVYHNSTDGYYFKAHDGLYHQVTSYSTTVTVDPNELITTDQRGELRQATPTIGAYELPMQYQTQADGDWSTAGNWEYFDGANWQTATVAPDSLNDTITINHNITVNSNIMIDQTTVATGAVLTVINGSLLTVANGVGADLIITGALINNGSTDLTIGTEVLYNGTSQNITTSNYYNLTFAGSGSKILTGDISIINAFNINAGTFIHNNYGVTYNGADQTVAALNYYDLTFAGSGNKTLPDDIGVAGTFTVTTGTFMHNNYGVIYNGTNQLIAALNYYDLTFNGAGSKTLNGNIEVSDSFTVNSGILIGNNYEVTYSGTNQVIAALNYYDLKITGDNADWSAGTSVSNILTIDSSMSSTITLTQGNSGSVNTIHQLIMNGDDAILKLNDTATISNFDNATFDVGTGTVAYSGTAQTIAIMDYNTLVLSGSGSTKTFTDGITKINNAIIINDALTITGSSRDNVTVQVTTPGYAGTASRVFAVNAPGATINISDITMKGGYIRNLSDVNRDGGSILLQAGTLNLSAVEINSGEAYHGGAIAVYADNTTTTLNVTNSLINNNKAQYGGGIYQISINSGSSYLSIQSCILSENESSSSGGAIYNNAKTANNNIEIINSNLVNNIAGSSGGAIYTTSTFTTNTANIEVTNSTLANNSANYGGAVYSYIGVAGVNILIKITDSDITANNARYGGAIYSSSSYSSSILTFELTNSTLSNNNASNYGGAVYLYGHSYLNLLNSTISGNHGNTTGGIYSNSSNSQITLSNSIITYNYQNDNSGYTDINSSGTINGDYNIVGNMQVGSNSINYSYTNGMGDTLFTGYNTILADTIYQPILANNGGNTQTIALDNNSIASAAGTVTGAPVTDQRGMLRIAVIDIGAYQISRFELGDYLTVNNGNWTDTTSWNYYDGTNWVVAITVPDSTANNIYIQHNIAIDTTISIDQTFIIYNGQLTVNSGQTLTIADGSGDDLIVNNTLIVSGTISINTGATVELLTNSTVNYNGGNQNIAALNYHTLQLNGSGTKTLANGVTTVANEILLTDSMTVTGSSRDNVTLQVSTPGNGGTASRVFNVNASTATVNISNLTIKGGNISGLSGIASYGGTILLQSGTLNLSDVAITGSRAYHGGGVALYSNNVASSALLTITDSLLSSNTATHNGGAIYSSLSGTNNSAGVTLDSITLSNNNAYDDGTVYSSSSADCSLNISITDSTISHNRVGSRGGAINLNSSDNGTVILNLTRTTIDNNIAISGGGINSDGNNSMTITASTISNNNASYGGGIRQSTTNSGIASINLINSTVSGNRAISGGGIYQSTGNSGNQVELYLTNSTISGNSAADAGGIYSEAYSSGIAAVYARNSIIAGNSGNADFYSDSATVIVNATEHWGEYNIIGTQTTLNSGQVFAAVNNNSIDVSNPGLYALADYGGTTATMLPVSGGSAATFIGLDLSTIITTDQRGETRTGTWRTGAVQRVVGDSSYDNAISNTNWTVVTTANDLIDLSDNVVSLREAISFAAAGSTITFSNDYTIGIDSRLPFIIHDLNIDGNGRNITVTGDSNSDGDSDTITGIFSITAGTVTIDSLTITKGYSDYGGAIYNVADLTISNSQLTSNRSIYSGGAIFNVANTAGTNVTLTVNNSTISDNHADNGGGIYNNGSFGGTATVNITNSTVSANQAATNGGGIANISDHAAGTAYLTVTNSTISDNIAYGGAVYNNAGDSLNNSVVNYATANFIDCTVTGNSGGGLYNNTINAGVATIDMTNTIVAYNSNNSNSGYSDINNYGGTFTGDYNILGNYSLTGTGNTNYSYTNGKGAALFAVYNTITANNVYQPQLTTNGGDTMTVALANDSIAIAAGTATGTPKFDQRGYLRMNGIDIGSYQLNGILVQTGSYITVNAGDWNDITIWKMYDGNDLIAATLAPDTTADTIYVQHAVAVTSDLTIDQTTITTGGSVLVNSGQTLTVADGTGTDLTIENGLTVFGTLTVAAGATADLADNSTVSYYGGDQTIAALAYSNLVLYGAGTTKTFADGITSVEHDIMIDSGSMTLTGSSSSNVTVQVADPGITQSRVFYIGNSNYPTAIVNISNMTIKGGDVSALVSPLNSGGAVYLAASTLNLNNVVISDGKAVYGGGLATSGNTILNITNSTINNNSATSSGGGIFSYSELNISNSTIDGNTASSRGGGIDNNGNATLNNVTVSNNQAVTGGGIVNSKMNLIINSSTIDSNYASRDGGGIATSYTNDGTVTITDSSIINNSAGSSGGGINSFGVSITIDNCLVDNNHAGYGGGISNRYKDITIANSIITNNRAAHGAGFYNSYAFGGIISQITATVIENNSASTTAGGIYNGATLNIKNSSISGNSASETVAGIYNQSTLTVINSTIADNNGAATGGIQNTNVLYLINSTISGNSASASSGTGGLYVTGQSSNYLLNSIVINNSATTVGNEDMLNDNATALTAYYSRFDSAKINGTITTDATDIDAVYNNELGLLADNGGETKTMALLTGSPMLNTGTEAYYNDGAYFLAGDGNYHQLSDYSIIVTPYSDDLIATDQRGVERGSSSDIGAYEYITGYFRSHNDGVWSTVANWELLDAANSSWSTASVVPTAATVNHVEIAHQITINGTPDIDQLHISGHGELTVATGATLNIINGDGDDLRIDGKLTVNGTVNNAGSVVNNGSINLTSDSHFNYTTGDQNVLTLNYGYLGLSGANSIKTFANGTSSVAHEISLIDAGMTVTGLNPYNPDYPWRGSANAIVQVTTPGSDGTAARVFHTNVGTGNNITIENMLIKGGDISGLSGDAANGGSIFHESGTLTINNAKIDGAKAVFGGGVYSKDITSINDSTLSGGYATNSGGGLFNHRTTVNLTDTTVKDNTADIFGGGIDLFLNAQTTIKGTTISNNTAKYGGGAINHISDFIIENSTIANNSATSIVGGIFSNRGSITMLNATITNNSAATDYAAVYGYNSDIYVVNTVIINNSDAKDFNSINSFNGNVYVNYSWYDNSRFSVSAGHLSGSHNQTSAYVAEDFDNLGDNGGDTYTVKVNSGAALTSGTFVYGNSIDGYYFGSSGHYFDLDGSGHSGGTIDDKITTDQRGLTRDDAYIPTMGAYEVNIDTTMIDELPDGNEWNSDEFSDLIKVHSATQDDFDSALLEFIA